MEFKRPNLISINLTTTALIEDYMGANSRLDNRPVKTPSLLTNKHEFQHARSNEYHLPIDRILFALNTIAYIDIHTSTISSMATRTDMQ